MKADKKRKSKIIKSELKKIKLLVLDVDGVLTNGSIIYDSRGIEYKIFNVQDGSGIKRIIERGIKVALVTGRESPIVVKRARELGVKDVYQGVNDKRTVMKKLLAKYDILPEEVCAVGDDILDLGLMKIAGFTAAVANARPEVKKAARYITAARGGAGAVREVIDMINNAQDKKI